MVSKKINKFFGAYMVIRQRAIELSSLNLKVNTCFPTYILSTLVSDVDQKMKFFRKYQHH